MTSTVEAVGPVPVRALDAHLPAPAIEIEGLTKVYRRGRRRVVAVDDLHLVVPRGGVFGFLGPNGSGKTSTIRAMTGLLRSFDGTVRILGEPVPTRLDVVVDRIGALVESPAFFPAFSGRRNLALLAGSRGITSDRVDTVLAEVGLDERSDDPVRGYSLGMRQRLGVAAALLKDPALLILDEPANGLDPDGMREMRLMLRRIARAGRTVFISSHLLDEVSQLCDRVAVLKQGRCVFSGAVSELTAPSGNVRVLLQGGDPARTRALELLRDDGREPVVDADGKLLVAAAPGEAWQLVRWLAERELWVEEIAPVQRTLEDGYTALVHRHDVLGGGERR